MHIGQLILAAKPVFPSEASMIFSEMHLSVQCM